MFIWFLKGKHVCLEEGEHTWAQPRDVPPSYHLISNGRMSAGNAATWRHLNTPARATVWESVSNKQTHKHTHTPFASLSFYFLLLPSLWKVARWVCIQITYLGRQKGHLWILSSTSTNPTVYLRKKMIFKQFLLSLFANNVKGGM